MSNEEDVFECDVCSTVATIEIHTSPEDDDVIYCPVCGEEYSYDYDDDQEDFIFDDE